MTTKKFAAMLNGREIGDEISREEAGRAKALGLVVVYGASDDLMELQGAITDEVGCYDGGMAYLDADGLFPVDDACDECKLYQRARKACKTITALWDSGNGFAWSYQTDIPHETFDIMEDEEPYCRGIVFELEAFDRTDINAAKSFLSKCDDQYRAAYARKTEKHLRRCVFFGTTNDNEYLKDPTGNRRFWPVDTMLTRPRKSVFNDLTQAEVDQIWAEAVMRWRFGEPLFLSPEMEQEAELRRSGHFDIDPLQGQIEDYLSKPVPANWREWDARARMMYWGGGAAGEQPLVPRDRVCAIEVWRECMGGMSPAVPRKEARRINRILESLPGLERVDGLQFGAGIGRQRGYKIADQT